MKCLCLFAGYSGANHVDDYVVHYLGELAKLSDVYYQAANEMREGELEKLDAITRGRWAQAHDKYDFGSWQKLIFRLGWQEIEKYDAIILANDSNYGPLRDLGVIFDRMGGLGLDAWGITENYGGTRHLQSYFLVLNRAVIDSFVFRDFFESIAVEKSKNDVCVKYEIGLSRLLSANGFSFASFIDRSALNIPFEVDVSSYQNTLLRSGAPFLKRKVFLAGDFASEDIAQTRALLQDLKYPLEWIQEPASNVAMSVKASTEGAEASVEAGSTTETTTASPAALQGSVIRGGIKRLLRPFYVPIKARVIDRLVGIEQRVTKIDAEVGGLRNQLHSLEISVGNLLDATANTHGQLSGISQASRDTISRIGNLLDATANTHSRIIDLSRDDESRLTDLQTSITELHGHVDWVQRDILIALMSQIDLKSSKGFKCMTDYPVAYDSPDHIHPVGTVLDHTRHPRFIRACEDFFGSGKRLSFLDLGCSAGGIVWDAILRGHIGVGLEGSDISRLQQRAEWRLLGDSLFTCDITRPFELAKGEDGPFKFDVISAWEVLEHLTPDGVDGMFANLARHTRPGSVFACSISQVDGGFTEDGKPLHQTLEPLPWWRERAAKHGFDVLDSDAFTRLDFARGNGNSSIYYRPAHSYQEKEGDCFLVVFQRR